MSDISIPGVKSKYDTPKLIEDLMKVERVPRDRAAADLKKIETSKVVWQELGVKMSKLRELSKGLYSFNNPFTERLVKSANEDVLTGSATREAMLETRMVLVKQVAEADRFLSGNLPKDFKVPSGAYGFKIGEKSVSLQFSGGTLKEFADAITRKGKDLIKASVIQITADTQAIAVESLLTGKMNRMAFEGATADFALKAGLVERASTSTVRTDIGDSALKAYEAMVDRTKVTVSEGTVRLASGSEVFLPSPKTVQAKGSLTLEFEIKVTKLPETDIPREQMPTGPVLPDPGSMTFSDVTVSNEPSATVLPEWKPKPVPEKVSDLQIAFAKTGGKFVPLAQSADGNDFTKVQVPLASLGNDFEGLALRNRNTFREVEVRNVRVFDPEETGGFKPVHPVSTAKDAIVSMDGIEVTRDKNEITNLIPGVTLNLHEASDKQVKLKIEPNREAAKDAIIALVGEYNKLAAQINILSRTDEKVISELDYFTDEEKKTAKERLGLFQGDFTLNQIKTATQRIFTSSYPTKLGQELSLLSQMGISTDARRFGSGYDASKLRGYIEIDEPAMDKALQGDMVAIRELFGKDTDGDLIVDSGAGYSFDMLMKPYVETGGIMSSKNQTYDAQIKDQKKRIESFDTQLAKKEDELKRKYGMMEGALNQMERTSGSITNFSKNNGN